MEENKDLAQEQSVEIENMSDEALLNIVLDKLDYEMVKDILVKPLDVIKVKRMTNVPVGTGEKDEEGVEIMEMKQEEIEVDSSFRSGIILSLPTGATYDSTLKVGMKIVYPHKYSIDFDIFKDSVLVKPYDVVAKIKD
jgi:hypothetical protein